MDTSEEARLAGQHVADAVFDAFERITLKLTDAIAQTRAEQAELRDEVHALANRIESVVRAVRLLNQVAVYDIPDERQEAVKTALESVCELTDG